MLPHLGGVYRIFTVTAFGWYIFRGRFHRATTTGFALCFDIVITEFKMLPLALILLKNQSHSLPCPVLTKKEILLPKELLLSSGAIQMQ